MVEEKPIDVMMKTGFGWRCHAVGEARFWFKGYLHKPSIAEAGRLLVDALSDETGKRESRVQDALKSLDGHFALVVDRAGICLAAVDRVRSIPLFITDGGVSSHAPTLARSLPSALPNRGAALALAMAGYTVGNDTIVEGVRQIGPGEFAVSRQGVGGGAGWNAGQYDLYAAWQIKDEPEDVLRDRLRETTLTIIRKMADSANGRTFVVPLSAGLDSRLIVSGLKHIGYDNVKCFSYGIAGNYETEASKRIADTLGYEWRKWPYTNTGQAAFFKGRLHRDYLHYCDSLCSVPFVQDLAAIKGLKDSRFIPDDAILVNGNSGDYISGGHVPKGLMNGPLPSDGVAASIDHLLSTLIGKHFRLWQDLATGEHDKIIEEQLRALVAEKQIPSPDDASFHGVYEFLEFYTRQSRYVITGQRIYEFLGHEWRLPLWDNDYLDFWQAAPLSVKSGQKLYRDMLEESNWGGVWGKDWTYRHRVSPAWIRYLVRPPLKLLHAPLGPERWHRFEKRYLDYWMDLWAAVAVVPRSTTWRDTRGARSFVSWHNEAYLASKGLGHDGQATSFGFKP